MPSHTRLTISAGGARTRENGCTNPLAAIPPSVNWQQDFSQDWLETNGPAGVCAFFRQQHFAWLRPQEAVDPLKARADSCTREAKDNKSARHAATSARTSPEMSFFPSILVEVVYHVP